MTFWEFLSEKAVTLCFLGIGALAAGSVMAFAGAEPEMIGLLAGMFLFFVLGWLGVSFYLACARIQKLERIIDHLPEKYLLGEVLDQPYGVLEKQYYRIMKQISASAISTAQQADKEKQDYCDYVEGWIHEIKTPLTACSLILDNGGDARKLRRELKRADNLTESILYYARMRTIEKDTQIQKVQAADLIGEAVKSQMEILVASSVSVDVSGDFTAYIDKKSVCFILKQLLINSAKYCRGCRICIQAADGIITFEDNGIGIPDYELRRVTERGFTGKAAGQTGGTGMGLYIVKELCDRLGIGLTIQSKEGVFTRIILELYK